MSHLTIAAVRGAISVPADRADAIRAASARLLQALISRNALTPERVVSAVFTATPVVPHCQGMVCVRPISHDTSIHSGAMLPWLGSFDMSSAAIRPFSTQIGT